MLVLSSLSRNATQAMVLSLVFKHCISSRPAPRKQPLEPPESVKSSSKYVAYSGTFKPRTKNSNAKSATQKDSEPGQKRSVDAEAESGNVGTAIQKANQHRMIEETKRRVARHFTDQPELPATHECVKRLRKCVGFLQLYVKEDHIVDFTTHVYASKPEEQRARIVLAPNGTAMMLFKEGTVRAFSENALAMIAAHEISHLVMKHHGPSRGGHSTSAEKLRIKQEFEADHLGLMMMAIAGYDPQGAIEWMEYAIQQEKRLPNYTIPAGHHTHPPTQERLARLRAALPEAYEQLREGRREREKLAKEAKEREKTGRTPTLMGKIK